MNRTSLIGLAGLGYLLAPDTASAQQQTFTLGSCDGGCSPEDIATANQAMAEAAANLDWAPGGVLMGRFSQGSSGNLPVHFTTSCAGGAQTCHNQQENFCEYRAGDNSIACNPNTLNTFAGGLMTLLMHEGVHSVGGDHSYESGCLMNETFSVFTGWSQCDYDYFWTFSS